jgi:hypothetical protein
MAYADLRRDALLKVEAEGLESNLMRFAQGHFFVQKKITFL